MLNVNGALADLLLSENLFDFYSPSFLLEELSEYKDKLMKILKSGSTDELSELQFMITKNIRFISEFQIDKNIWKEAQRLTTGIDFDDIAFVALTLHLNGILWTGDKRLKTGLEKKSFDAVVDTQTLVAISREKK